MRNIISVYLDPGDTFVAQTPASELRVQSQTGSGGSTTIIFPADLEDRIRTIDSLIDRLQFIRTDALIRIGGDHRGIYRPLHTGQTND